MMNSDKRGGKMRIFAILSATLVMILIVGCQTQTSQYGQVCYPLDEAGNAVIPAEELEDGGVIDITGDVVTVIEGDEDTVVEIEEEPEEVEEVIETEEDTPVEEEEENDSGMMTVTEGDVVDLSRFKAVDDDGDALQYTYEEPFDDNGKWVTEVGDAGEYITTITVSDGENSATLDIVFKVASKNKAPVFVSAKDVVIEEGDTVTLDVTVDDPEGDEVKLTYSGWMTTATKKTGSDDSGVYTVTVTASDGINKVSKDIKVTVNDVNKPPVFKPIQDLIVVEGDLVKINAEAEDPEGDEVEITFEDPLDEAGSWQTKAGDVGIYDVEIMASDGKNEVIKTVKIFVKAKNSAPEIKKIDPIVVQETDTIILNPVVSDPDGDDVEITYTGWMNTDTKVTTYDDEGEYIVTITASDGENESSLDVTITVLNKNRPPTFVG